MPNFVSIGLFCRHLATKKTNFCRFLGLWNFVVSRVGGSMRERWTRVHNYKPSPIQRHQNRFCTLIYCGSRVNQSTKFEDPTAIRSSVMSSDISHRIPLTVHLQPLRMRRISWPMRRGQIFPTYLKSVTPICLFTIQMLWRYDDV